MLVLSRRIGESIVIEGGIRVVVLSSDRRGVRLGIEAPAETSIVRGEIVAEVALENRRAASAPDWAAAALAPIAETRGEQGG